MRKKQVIWRAKDKPPIWGYCDGCDKSGWLRWYEGNPAHFGGERRFVGAFCSDECAEKSGKFQVV